MPQADLPAVDAPPAYLAWWRTLTSGWRVVAEGSTDPEAFRKALAAVAGESGDLVVLQAGKRPDIPRRRAF